MSFPPGRVVGQSRVWFESEVNEWLDKRPVKSVKPLKGGARDNQERAKAEARAP